jgi:hypothetical protein
MNAQPSAGGANQAGRVVERTLNIRSAPDCLAMQLLTLITVVTASFSVIVFSEQSAAA